MKYQVKKIENRSIALLWKLVCVAAVFGMMTVFYACSRNNIQKQDKKIITAVLAGTLNPKLTNPATANVAMILYETVYEPLVRYGVDGKIESGLAESWLVNDGGKTLVFNLRRGVKFSDGSDFNADSVIAATRRWNNSFFSSPLESVKKIDNYTVSFTFQSASYPVLTELTYPRPVRIPAATAFDANDKFIFPIGTGRWMIESYIEDEEVTLVPNPYYYGEKPKLDKLILRAYPEIEKSR